jgi:5-methyltetrahydropteroyltriglutamate--homocysteine methyltransferase
MAIRTTVVGSYPKPPDEGQTFTVRKTLHAIERGDATPDDLKTARDQLAALHIAEQEEAGIDLVTDGLARWDDILTPFARTIRGFEIGGLLRWFDNNVYYRRPICIGDLEWGGPSSVDGLRHAKSVSSKPVKAVLPGPVTFARLSVDEHYGDHDRFVEAIARVLAQEAFELEAAGADVIQIDEPALLNAPEDLALAKDSIATITNELKSTTTLLCTYFGDAKRLGAELFDIGVDGFGFDLVSGPENVNLIAEAPKGKTIQAGVVDARNTRLEDAGAVAERLEGLANTVGAGSLWASPSAGLEFLPREKARAKLHLLTEAARKVGA